MDEPFEVNGDWVFTLRPDRGGDPIEVPVNGVREQADGRFTGPGVSDGRCVRGQHSSQRIMSFSLRSPEFPHGVSIYISGVLSRDVPPLRFDGRYTRHGRTIPEGVARDAGASDAKADDAETQDADPGDTGTGGGQQSPLLLTEDDAERPPTA